VIPESHFILFERLANSDEQSLLRRHYALDENAVAPEFVLNRATRELASTEATLSASLNRLADSLPDTERILYQGSLTAQEVGEAFRIDPASRGVRAYFMPIDDAVPPDRDLSGLKADLYDWLGASRIRDYGDNGRGAGYAQVLHQLAEDLHADLTADIDSAFSEGTVNEVSEESQHNAFAVRGQLHFHDRSDILTRVSGYFRAAARHPLVLQGAPGSGNTALMASVAGIASSQVSDATVVARFAGITPSACEARTLAAEIAGTLQGQFGYADTRQVPSELSSEWVDIAPILALARADRKIVLIIDGPDQLASSTASPDERLGWLPMILPEHVLVVISISGADDAGWLRKRLPADAFVHVEPFTISDADDLLSIWLTASGRTLQPRQRDAILGAYKASQSVLQLRIAFEEARTWTSSSSVSSPVVAPTVHEAVRGVIEELSDDAAHGRVLVEHALAYLGSAKFGLTEDEVLDLLSADDDVMQDVRRRFPQWPITDGRFPIAPWLRLLSDLQPYLARRRVGAEQLISLFTPTLTEIVKQQSGLSESRVYNAYMADYFAGQPARWHGETDGSPNFRRLIELPYQQTLVGDAEGLVKLSLGDLGFLQDKVAHFGIDAVLEDFARALNTGGNQGNDTGRLGRNPYFAMLEDVQRVLALEVSALRAWIPDKNPDLFNQQVKNRAHLLGLRFLEEHEEGGSSHAINFSWRSGQPTQRGRVAVLSGHRAGVTSIVQHPDPNVLLTGSSDGTIRVWNLPEARVLRTVDGHDGTHGVNAMLPDGWRAVFASTDNTLVVWDTATGRRLRTLTGHDGMVTQVAVVGRHLVASSSVDATIRLWDINIGKQVRVLRGHRGAVSDLAVARQGELLVSGGADKILRTWNLESDDGSTAMEGHEGAIMHIIVNRDGSRAVTAGFDEEYPLRFWDLDSGTLIRSPESHWARVDGLAMSGSEDYAASGSIWANNVYVWDLSTGAHLSTLEGAGGIREGCICYSRAGFVVTMSGTGLQMWEPGPGEVIRSMAMTRPIELGALDAAERRAFLADSDGNLHVVDLMGQDTFRSSDGPWSWAEVYGDVGYDIEPASAIVAVPDSDLVLSASGPTWRLWDAQNGESIRVFRGHDLPIRCMAVIPDGTLAISGSDDTTVRVWDIAAGTCLHILRGHEPPPDDGHGWSAWRVADPISRQLAFAADAAITSVIALPGGKSVLTASRDRTVRIWDIVEGHELAILRGHRHWITDVAVSPDGRMAVSGSLDSTARIWDINSGQALHVLAHDAAVRAVALIQNGDVAVTASEDGIMALWDAHTGRLIHRSRFTDVDWSIWPQILVMPDGKTIIIGDDPLTVWDVGSRKILASFCVHGKHDSGGGRLEAVALGPPGTVLASWMGTTTLTWWDAQDGRELARIQLDSGIGQLCTTAAGQSVLAGDLDGSIMRFDLVAPSADSR
jgi:WD40 repeat protein